MENPTLSISKLGIVKQSSTFQVVLGLPTWPGPLQAQEQHIARQVSKRVMGASRLALPTLQIHAGIMRKLQRTALSLLRETTVGLHLRPQQAQDGL